MAKVNAVAQGWVSSAPSLSRMPVAETERFLLLQLHKSKSRDTVVARYLQCETDPLHAFR